jgi:Flp pilus assembly protein TadG
MSVDQLLNIFAISREFVRRLRENRRGAIAVFLAIGAVPLVGFVGLATDVARGYMVKAKMHQALDAAGLAGARAILEPDRDQEIQQFFNANFPQNYLNASTAGPTIVADETEGRLTLTISATVPTSFMRVLGFQEMTVNARTVVQRAVRGMEMAMVMDNTGSMRSSSKIETMRDAAHLLISTLYGNRETVDDLWVSLVPYVATVNIGAARTGWLQNFDPNDYRPAPWAAGTTYGNGQFVEFNDVPYKSKQNSNFNHQPDSSSFWWKELDPISWKGCVLAREGGEDMTDTVPSSAPFTAQFWPTTKGAYGWSTGDNDWDWENIDETNGAENDGLGPNLGCGPAITPLVAEQSVIHDAIDEMQPWHRGGTMANLGLAWGWRTLSPDWRGLWGGSTPAALPLNYDEPLMDKVVVLLTDGNNEWYDWPTGLPNNPDADYSAYKRPSHGVLGTTSRSVGTTIVNNRMATVCNAMKAQGIIIYAITFQLNNTTTQALYRDCATSPAHYFNSPSNADLEDAFEEIGNELTNLRLAE